ncbi:MAG: hypothetical protein ACI4PV_05830, partial [Butyricicoccus sp.]
MNKRRTAALLLALLLGTQSLTAAQAADSSKPEAVPLDAAAGVIATRDLSAYENNQALVLYTDGNLDVMT